MILHCDECGEDTDTDESDMGFLFMDEKTTCGMCLWVGTNGGDMFDAIDGVVLADIGSGVTLEELGEMMQPGGGFWSDIWCECGSEFREASGRIIDGVPTCWRCLPENEGWENDGDEES